MTDYAQHLSALDRAVERAHKAHLKARSAAQGAVTNAKRQVQLNATARRTLTEWTELAEAASAVACALTELTALRLKTDPPELAGADHLALDPGEDLLLQRARAELANAIDDLLGVRVHVRADVLHGGVTRLLQVRLRHRQPESVGALSSVLPRLL